MGYLTKFEVWVGKRWGEVKPLSRKWTVACLGLPGETGEVVEHLKKHLRDDKVPNENLKLELGDVLHYLTVISFSYGWSLNDLAKANMEKLEARDERKRTKGQSWAE